MTRRNFDWFCSAHMRSAVNTVVALSLPIAVCIGGGTIMTACSPPPPPPVVVVPPPPPPPPPEPVLIDPVMQSMGPDKRVQFPQERAPLDETLARAVINFASALAKGDEDAMGKMLAPASRPTLDQLTSTGEWDDSTAKIEAVRIIALSESPGDGPNKSVAANIQLAVQEPGAAYLLGWNAENSGGTWLFSGADAPGGDRARASDWDDGSVSAAAPAGGGGGEESSAAPSASIIEDQRLVFTYAALELVGQIEQASGSKVSDADRQAAIAALSATVPGTLEELRPLGRAKIESGFILPDPGVAGLVTLGDVVRTRLGDKITHDRVIAMVSSILNMSEKRLREIIGEPMGGGAGGGGKRPTSGS